jgi:hypothetical protein
LSAFAKAISEIYTTFAPEFNRVLFCAIYSGMENKKNNNQSTQESSSVSQHRHQEAKDFTKEVIEELFSSDKSDAAKSLARTPDKK